MRVGDLAACEGEEEEEGRSEELAEDGDEGVVGPFWNGAVEGREALAERLGVLEGRRVSQTWLCMKELNVGLTCLAIV